MIQKIKLTTRKGKVVIGRRLVVHTEFSANIKPIWTKIQDIDTLREICKSKARFVSIHNAPLIWEEGQSFVFKLFLYGIIPIGAHTIHLSKIDPVSRKIESQEYNKTVVIWNHYIKMEEIAPRVTKYTDCVDLYAGYLTSIVAWWALKFYKHRQRKWQKIAKSL